MSRGTLDTALPTCLSLTGLSPSLAGLPRTILLGLPDHKCGPNPGALAPRFGLCRFRSPLLPVSIFSFFSSGYLDVSVHRVPSVCLLGAFTPCSTYGDGGFLRRVSPFRYPRLSAYLQLPVAFRSLSRLSSALSAKASTLRSSSLNHTFPV